MMIATLAIAPTSAWAATIEIGPNDNAESAIAALNPGDELVLRGGMYSFTDRFTIDLAATAAMPILIRAKEGERPHLHRPDANQNLIDLVRVEYVTIRGIEFSGGSAGLRIQSADHFTLEDCEIHSTADVALRANDVGATYESVRFSRNHIHDTHGTGEGMYLGCNDGGCVFRNGLIEGNWVHDLNAQDIVQGDGIEIKEGSHDNIIRDNVIHDTNYPCILTYSAAGNGGPNIIERNVMWNCGDHGIQSAADAVIRNNIILSSNADGIAMQPHQSGAPSSLVVVHNTILKAQGSAISVRGNTGSVVIANNVLFAQNGDAIFVSGGAPAMITTSANAGVGSAPGALIAAVLGDLVNASYSGAPPMDVFPANGVFVGAGDTSYVADDDFNGTTRGGVADIGAYKFAAGGNPGWRLESGFKVAVPVAPVDGGAGEDAQPADAAGRDAEAAESGVDAGVIADADAGVSSDAGAVDGSEFVPVPNREEDEGCGCHAATSRGASLSLAVVFALWLVRRRGR